MKKPFILTLILVVLVLAVVLFVARARQSEPQRAELPASSAPTELPTLEPPPTESPTPEPVLTLTGTPLVGNDYVAFEATPCATLPPLPTPTPSPEPTPTPTPEPTPTPAPTPFTIAWIADTQNYAYSNDKGLEEIVRYTLEHREDLNIVAVLQSGDLIENNAVEREWEKIAGMLEPLRGEIPFYCVCGNHDLGVGTGASNVTKYGYDAYFRYDLCDVRDDAQRWHNGECWYQLLEEQGILLVGIGWHTGDGEKERNAWLNEVLDTYSEYPAVILTHSYLYNDGNETKDGLKLKKQLIDPHPNVRLLFCGHHKGARRLTNTYKDGRTFTAVMYNLQADRKKSNGYFVLITFDPLTRNVSFTSYSPVFDDYNFYDKTDKETFTLENAY